MDKNSIYSQLKDNFIALISLVIAIIAILIASSRENQTEINRNLRLAAFEVLKNLGELQVIVNYGHYEPKNSMGNPVLGWGRIALIGDLSQLLPPPIPEITNKLVRTWGEQWSKIKDSEESTDQISENIDRSRLSVLELLKELR